MPKVNPHADPTRRDLGPAALGRTVKKLFSYYPVLAPVTFVCILFSSIVSSVPSLFTQNIIQIIDKTAVHLVVDINQPLDIDQIIRPNIIIGERNERNLSQIMLIF